MMRISPVRTSRKPENTIALINVVFLMLIFFLVAGTLAPSPDRNVDFITLAAKDPAAPPDMLYIRADGTLTWRGNQLPLSQHVRRWENLQREEADRFRCGLPPTGPCPRSICSIRLTNFAKQASTTLH
jgi:biopolymer transport protein ExbD